MSNSLNKQSRLIEIIKANPPSYEKLVEDLAGLYSRRLNIQHRLVYEVFEEEKVVKILSMWTHYRALVLGQVLCNAFVRVCENIIYLNFSKYP